MFTSIIIFLYGVAGLVSAAGYIPQAYRSWKDKSQAQSTSLIAWGIWCFTTTACVLYAIFINTDPLFIAYNILQFIGVVAVFLITVYKR